MGFFLFCSQVSIKSPCIEVTDFPAKLPKTVTSNTILFAH